MWHYNRVLKKLDIYWGSFICLSTLSSLAVPITPRTEQEWEDQALGWVGAGQTQRGEPFNGLWEDRPVDEWTPELMGSVSTKLLRKENPSQGGHFTFYFYCMSHRLFSSTGFSGKQRRSKERTFFFLLWSPMYSTWHTSNRITQLWFYEPSTFSRTQYLRSNNNKLMLMYKNLYEC